MIFFGGFAAVFVAASQFSQVRDSRLLEQLSVKSAQPIAVHVSGAVQKPGIYYVEPGASVKELLKMCPLSGSADRKKIPLKKVIYSPQKIVIEEK